MTAIADHCSTIRDWLNYDSYSDELITSWTRMFEEWASEKLRSKHMIAIDTAYINQRRVMLPSDWLEIDFVHIIDGKPLHFRTRDEFYRAIGENRSHANEGYYTLTGNYLIIGGDISSTQGKSVELSYYQTIPPLGDDVNWLMAYYSRLYVTGTLSVATAYGIEHEKAAIWQAAAQELIDTINANDKAAKSSGSAMKPPRRKGFG